MKKHVVANYRYGMSGLPRLTVHDLVKYDCPSCGKVFVRFPKIGPLHRAIANALAAKSSRLTPFEVRYLRDFLGWSNEEFARRMGVTPYQSSRWMKQPISNTAERLLRLYVVIGCEGDAKEKARVLRGAIDCFAAGISSAREARLDARLRGKTWRVEIQ
jgi:transcriptional regulator with XRE-family HTH domain